MHIIGTSLLELFVEIICLIKEVPPDMSTEILYFRIPSLLNLSIYLSTSFGTISKRGATSGCVLCFARTCRLYLVWFFLQKKHGRGGFLYLALLLSVLSKVLSTSAFDSTTSNEFSKTIPESILQNIFSKLRSSVK